MINHVIIRLVRTNAGRYGDRDYSWETRREFQSGYRELFTSTVVILRF